MRLSRTRLWLLARINPTLASTFRDLAAEAKSNHEALALAETELGECRDRNQELASRLDTLAAELRDERHEHAKTAKQLELAGEENRLLAAIHETDIARRKREHALLDRERAEAETALLLARRQSEEE